MRLQKRLPALFSAMALALALYAAQPKWEKPVESWTPDDVEALLTNSPWSVQSVAAMEDPYDAKEPEPAGPPDTGQKGVGANKPSWDGGVGRNRMGHLATVPVMLRWESALPIRQAQKDSPAPDQWYVISVAGLVPAGRYRAVGKTETASSSDDSVDARNPEELLEAFMQNSKISQKSGPDLQPENVKLDPATGVVRIFFSRKTVIDPEQKDILFITHLGKLNVKAKFKISAMKYHGKIEL